MAPIGPSTCDARHEHVKEQILDEVSKRETDPNIPNIVNHLGHLHRAVDRTLPALTREFAELKGAVATQTKEIGELKRENAGLKSIATTMASQLAANTAELQRHSAQIDGQFRQIFEMLGQALRHERKMFDSTADAVVASQRRAASSSSKRTALRYKLAAALLSAAAMVIGRVSATFNCSHAPAQAQQQQQSK